MANEQYYEENKEILSYELSNNIYASFISFLSIFIRFFLFLYKLTKKQKNY